MTKPHIWLPMEGTNTIYYCKYCGALKGHHNPITCQRRVEVENEEAVKKGFGTLYGNPADEKKE